MDPVTEERIKFTNRMVDKYSKEFEDVRAGQSSGNAEMAHSLADALLCSLLNELGYSDIVKLWASIPKWYA